jgi:hypothetical protein
LLTLPTLNSSCRLNLELYNKAFNIKRSSIQMEKFTMGTLIRVAKEKELESEYGQTVTKIMENGILINNMGAERWNSQMVAVGGGNARMVTGKDMEHGRGLMETDTSGNT